MAPSGTALDLIFQQLADLFLRSIPTVVLFLLLLAAYRLLVHRPLLKVLADRRERPTGGAGRARPARADIFHAREQRVQAMQRERDRVLEEARHSAHETVRAARERLEAEATVARATLDSRADALAAEILRVIVPSASSVAGSAPRGAY